MRRRSGVALAMRHRHQWFSTYGLKAWKREMSTPYAPLWNMVDFTFTVTFNVHRTHSSRTISLSAVSSTHACELSPGLHRHVHSKFINILGQSFKPVPSSKEYFYFYSSARRHTMV